MLKGGASITCVSKPAEGAGYLRPQSSALSEPSTIAYDMLTRNVTFKYGDGANITHEERIATVRDLQHVRYVEVAFSAGLLRVDEPSVMVVQDCLRVCG